MSSAAPELPRRLSWREFAELDVGDAMRGVELVDGLLEEGEVPTRKHGRIISRLIARLGPAVERAGGGELLSQDNRVRIGPRRVRKPDVLLALRKDAPQFEDETLVSAPSLVVEVVTKTPRDEHRDRVSKLADYESIGARQYWIIDPELDRLEVYVLGPSSLFGESAVYGPNDEFDGAALGFDGLKFRMVDLGADPLV